MPDYKKKKKHYAPLRKKKYSPDNGDIEVKSEKKQKRTSKSEDENSTSPKVIRGKKEKRIARTKVISAAIAILILLIIILKIIFPVGILEMLQHFFKTLGVGEYPIELAGNEVVGCAVENDHYYILTNTDVYFVTNNGKIITNFTHGHNSPVIKSSATRCLLYGIGNNEYDVYVNGDKKYSGTTESAMICGDISDSGVYAVASYSKTYASTVSVYNSKGNSIFKWNSASDVINSVVLSKNGKKLAVSTVNASGGKKYSKVYIFNFNNTNSEKTLKFDDNYVYDLLSNDNGFFIVLKKSVTFVEWSKHKQTETKCDYDTKLFKVNGKISAAVFTRQDNDTDNTVCLIDKKGNCTKKFSFSGNIKDIGVKGNHIFILSGNTVTLYDEKANKIGQISCDDQSRKIIPIDSAKFCLITDNTVTSHQIK